MFRFYRLYQPTDALDYETIVHHHWGIPHHQKFCSPFFLFEIFLNSFETFLFFKEPLPHLLGIPFSARVLGRKWMKKCSDRSDIFLCAGWVYKFFFEILKNSMISIKSKSKFFLCGRIFFLQKVHTWPNEGGFKTSFMPPPSMTWHGYSRL